MEIEKRGQAHRIILNEMPRLFLVVPSSPPFTLDLPHVTSFALVGTDPATRYELLPCPEYPDPRALWTAAVARVEDWVDAGGEQGWVFSPRATVHIKRAAHD